MLLRWIVRKLLDKKQFPAASVALMEQIHQTAPDGLIEDTPELTLLFSRAVQRAVCMNEICPPTTFPVHLKNMFSFGQWVPAQSSAQLSTA
jgi:hypothetical protein